MPASDSANLTALAMASPALGWASGFTLSNTDPDAPFEPLLAAWNGHRWRGVLVRLGRARAGRLDGLAAASPADAWAVGTAYPDSSTGQPLTEHWNGRRWARVPAPAVPGFQYASLLGVAVRSASDAWAVGEEENDKGVLRPLIEHWNGHRWRLTPAPDAGPQVALVGVSVAADGQAWAVGVPFADSRRPLVLRWTGRAWIVARTPQSSGAVLMNGITAVSPDDVWAVGTVSVRGGPYRAFATRWNGHRWVAARVPDRGPAADSRGFLSVTAIGDGRLCAIGSDQGSARGGALYGIWSGRAWSLRLGPLRRRSTSLNAVSYDGRHAIWAVGSTTLSQQAFGPVVQVNR